MEGEHMDEKALAEYIDNQRWLMNNGLLNDAIKNQLFMYGSIVHKEVQAVELAIDVEKKLVSYKIYITPSLLKKVNKYKELSTSKSLFGLWRFKRLLQKEGNLNFSNILNRFVKDFCGPKWITEVEILNSDEYVDEFEKSDGAAETEGDRSPNKPSDS